MHHPTHAADRTGQIWFRGELIHWPDGEPWTRAAETEVRTQKQAEDWTREQLAEHPDDMVQLQAVRYVDWSPFGFEVRLRADVFSRAGRVRIGWWAP